MNTQFFELYRVNGFVCGYPIDQNPFNRLRGEYDHCFHLKGRTAHFFLVTRDDTIGRTEAIVFATHLANGRAIHYHIDISQMKVEAKKWTQK